MAESNDRNTAAWRKRVFDMEFRFKGFTGYCGLEYTEITDEEVTISCDMRPELRNPAGIAHGGLIATISDVAASTMAMQADRVHHEVVTQSCSIHYLRPGVGDRLQAKARLIRKGSRICIVRVDCLDTDGEMISTAVYEIAYITLT